MSYAKIVNGQLEFAPKNKDSIINFNQNEYLLLLNGYKILIKAKEPEFGYLKHHIEYVETEKEIIETIIYDETEEEYQNRLIEEETKRIAQLKLTGADVERALYKVFNKDFDDIIQVIEQTKNPDIDIKALKIELKANFFYRGNPYVDIIGNLLGINSTQLDKFFETGDYSYLQVDTPL